jgi:hypothetical protein
VKIKKILAVTFLTLVSAIVIGYNALGSGVGSGASCTTVINGPCTTSTQPGLTLLVGGNSYVHYGECAYKIDVPPFKVTCGAAVAANPPAE